MTDTQVSKTILEQLGGNRFRAMTGASDFTAIDDMSLRFRLPGGGGRVKNGINFVTIRLDSSDTYTMIFDRVRRKGGLPDVKQIDKREDIYNDNLCEVFERVTGLATSLGGKRNG